MLNKCANYDVRNFNIKEKIYEELGQVEDERKMYEKALLVEKVRSERIVWLEAARFEERQEIFTRARTIL